MFALRTHLISCQSQRKHLLWWPSQSPAPPDLSVHLPKQFAFLSSHDHTFASPGELRSTPMPIMVIAKKSCRVMIEPPRKARAIGNRSTRKRTSSRFLWPENTRARKLFFLAKPSLPHRHGNDETSAKAATEARQGLSGQSAYAPCRSSVVGSKRKLDPERRAAMIAISCRYQPMVRFDNGARDGQPHAHAW